MAINSIKVSINNECYNGCIVIDSIKNTNTLGRIAKICIYRKVNTTGATLEKQYTINVTSLDDLTFKIYDYTTKSGTSYIYSITLLDGSENILEQNTYSNISCWFDGIFIGNESKQYMAELNCSTSIERNTSVSYVNTLSARTPYAVRNSNLNYVTGHSSGIFMRVNNGDLIADNTVDYANEVMNFLSDGTNKLLKTSDGGMWYVSIGQNINLQSTDHYAGNYVIEFDWTEIDDVPIMGKVI